MEGKISIGDFIYQVKKELKEAQDKSGDPFYQLEEVNLEISFVLEAKGDSKMNFYVVELGGGATATQTHKVSLKLVPLNKDDVQYARINFGKISGGGGGKPAFEVPVMDGIGKIDLQVPGEKPPKKE